MADLIEEGVTGVLFEPGDARSLENKLVWASRHPDLLAQMGRQARLHYEQHYTAERNRAQLLSIYGDAIAEGPRDE